MDIVLMTTRPDVWQRCLPVFANAGLDVRQATDLEQGLTMVKQSPPTLVIFDLSLTDADLRQAISRLLMLNAFVHTAVVSDQSDEKFHETMEGLGILMRLPSAPGPEDAARLTEALAALC